MRIGLNSDTSGTIPVDDVQVLAADAAKLGLDSVWTNQQPAGLDPLVSLPFFGDGFAEVGTAVVPTYPRHPFVMATQALTVQSLTGGRLTLGIGPGHKTATEDWLGLPYSSPARHTREYLEVLRPLLRGEHVKYAGEYYSVDVQAVSAAPPAVLVSALGPKMLEVTRDLADGTIAVWVRPGTVADYLVPRLGDGARVAVVVTVVVTEDVDGTKEEFARKFGMVPNLPAYRAILDRGGLTGPADCVVAGDERAVVRELGRFRDAGATDLIVSLGGTAAERVRTLGVIAGVER